MSYVLESSFPNEIDARVFISDPGIEDTEILAKHQSSIANGNYTEASDYICSQEHITPVTADLLNMIQNREIALQTYLLTCEKCSRAVYGDMPENPENNTIWINERSNDD